MGVLVFILTLLPLAGGYHMNLMKAESPGPSVGKLLPKVQSTAKILYKIYIAPVSYTHLFRFPVHSAVTQDVRSSVNKIYVFAYLLCCHVFLLYAVFS